ncbi:MAG TPA: MFS transporter [Candidatus Thermoplasmatota archaeon]|nr:MFS transporter [Candidatus Thermoplasmatota archaeon]
MARPRFLPAERALVATAAAIVFTRVFAFSLTTLGFTEFARALAPAGTPPATADLLAGIALGAYGVTMALAQLATGILSDRIGRRPVLLVGTAVFVLGAVACALATDLRVLVGARLLMGLGGVSSAAMAAVGETVPEERRTTAMALVGIPAGLGVFLGFLVGPAVAASFGFRSLFWATAALGLLASLALMRPLPAPLSGMAQPNRSLGMPVTALALAGFTINFAMNAVMFDFQTGVLPTLGRVGLAACLVAALLIMGVASRRVDRSRATWMPILVALAIVAVAAPLFRLSSALAMLLAAGTAFFAAHAILSAVLPSQVSRLAGRSGGLGHGIQLVMAYLGSAAGAIVAGAFARHLGEAFAVLAAFALCAMLLVVVGLRPATRLGEVPA